MRGGSALPVVVDVCKTLTERISRWPDVKAPAKNSTDDDDPSSTVTDGDDDDVLALPLKPELGTVLEKSRVLGEDELGNARPLVDDELLFDTSMKMAYESEVEPT